MEACPLPDCSSDNPNTESILLLPEHEEMHNDVQLIAVNNGIKSSEKGDNNTESSVQSASNVPTNSVDVSLFPENSENVKTLEATVNEDEQGKIISQQELKKCSSLHKHQSEKDVSKQCETPSCSPLNGSILSEKVETNMQGKCNEYRCDGSDSWSEDDDSSSTLSISSSDSDTFFDTLHESSGPKKLPVIKTKGELDLDDLPPIEHLEISVSEEDMEKIGKVHAIVDKLVVIRAFKQLKPLDLESVLFLSNAQPLGRVFDVFGPVVEPFYSIRFNTVEDIHEKGIKADLEIFYAPNKEDLTSFVFVDELQSQKGSDASWKHNNEPPEEFLDFSDDEKEKAAKRKSIAKRRNRNINNIDTENKRPYLQGSTPDRPIYIPSPRPAAPHNNNSFQFRRPNPFCQQRTLPPPPRLASLLTLRSPVPVHNVHTPPPNLTPSPLSIYSPPPQLSFQQQNSVQRPPQSPLLLASYSSPHVFGQVPALGPVSPALHTAVSFQSPILSNIHTFIPPQPPSPANPQNYFNQRIQQNISPALQSSPISPALQSSPISPDPWLPNRQPLYVTGNLPPNAPLTVQIPPNFSPSPHPVHPFNRPQFPQPFENQRMNFSNGNIYPRFR